MSGFPFRIGDLVSFKWPWASSIDRKGGIIIRALSNPHSQRHAIIQYEVLSEGELLVVPETQLSPQPVKNVSYKSGIMPKKDKKK